MYLHSVVLDALLKLHGEHATRQVNAQLDTQLQDLDKAAEATKRCEYSCRGHSQQCTELRRSPILNPQMRRKLQERLSSISPGA